jgi:hypothetical protein
MVVFFLTIQCTNNFHIYFKKKRLVDTVLAKASEKCKQVDEETASFLTKSDKLQGFMKEQFDKHQVLIDQKLTDPCNIWIVCEDSKMNNAEQELTSLTDQMKIASSKFKLTDPVKVRFLKEHCCDKIKEKEDSCRSEGVVVVDGGSNTLEVKGTQAGMKEMITFLEDLAGKVNSKVRIPFGVVCFHSPLNVLAVLVCYVIYQIRPSELYQISNLRNYSVRGEGEY